MRALIFSSSTPVRTDMLFCASIRVSILRSVGEFRPAATGKLRKIRWDFAHIGRICIDRKGSEPWANYV